MIIYLISLIRHTNEAMGRRRTSHDHFYPTLGNFEKHDEILFVAMES